MVICKYCRQEGAETKVNDDYYHKICYFNYIKHSFKVDFSQTLINEGVIKKDRLEPSKKEYSMYDKKSQEIETQRAIKLDLLYYIDCFAIIILIIFLIWIFKFSTIY